MTCNKQIWSHSYSDFLLWKIVNPSNIKQSDFPQVPAQSLVRKKDLSLEPEIKAKQEVAAVPRQQETEEDVDKGTCSPPPTSNQLFFT